LALALWIVTAVLDQPVYAGNCSWTGYVSSEWTTPGNWGSGCTGVNGIPSAGDTVNIPESGVLYEPSIGGDITLQGLNIQQSRVLSVLANATLNTPVTNFGTLALGSRTLTYTGGGFTNYGTVDGTQPVRTQGTVSLYFHALGQFNPPLEVVSGTTTASGLLHGSVTVHSGATLQVDGTHFVLYLQDNLTVNGTLSGMAANSTIYFYGNTLTNNGNSISVPNIYFFGSAQTLQGTGSFIDNTATIQSGSSVTLGSNHQMSNVIVNGSLSTPGVILDISGDFTNNGTYTHGNGALRFGGGTAQNLVLNVPTTFFNLAVASGTTLVETVAADNASVAGTLTNDGVIRKTRSVSGAGALSFGLSGMSTNVTTAGSLAQVQVDRIDRDHPNANALTATGRYWTITPTGAGYTVDLTLLRPASAPANALVCRNGPSEWDCAYNTATAMTVTRTGITELSDWAVGTGASVITIQVLLGSGGPPMEALVTILYSTWIATT
jgi:hypothetical protein